MALEKEFVVQDQVGSGAFSKVFKGRRIDDGHTVAIKKIEKAKVKNLEEIVREVGILKQVKHPNIIEFIAFFDTPKFSYIITEYLQGGELFDSIVDRGSYTESDAADLMRQITSAIQYLHSNSIVHRDLKPENLLCSSKDADMRIVISDFGLAQKLEGDETIVRSCGTPGYAAPEVLKKEPYRFKCDVFSCGVILYILLCGYPPFYSDTDDDKEIFKATIANQWEFEAEDWDPISEQAKTLIRRMMDGNPTTRPSAAEILSDSWVSGLLTPRVDIHRRVSTQLTRFFAKQRWKRAINVTTAANRMSQLLASANASTESLKLPPPPADNS
eukprot:TRINITY_DN12386_c0_g1_i3.p1 TRINITY_DN12386_c0_g1~~TRINITY_DN12386_c0_g1_i3.p1  ORF type:complete len:329 (+),score=75.28 TRINITY_DN12386_c0_g1_i3:127-1113(+)